MRSIVVVAMALLVCLPASAVQRGYDTAKLLNATEGRDVQVFWQFTLRLQDQVVVADYRPAIPWNFTLLQEFAICGPVKIRMDGKHAYLLRPGGKQIRLNVRLRFMKPRANIAAAGITEQEECASVPKMVSWENAASR
jgi:hypothetical protein